MTCVVAIDAGTTGVRAYAVGDDGIPKAAAYREFPQHFPRPGWVEHDALDILRVTRETLAEVASTLADTGQTIVAIGITNQRESVVVWDRRSGEPRARAIVWQDRRTAERCDELREGGYEPMIRRTTGLVLDPYFSASKLSWLLHAGGVAADDDLMFGTVDTWLLWNLTGGPAGGVHATDPSNASRTMLYDIRAGAWSPELCDLFDIPRACLPEVRPSSGRFGTTAAGWLGDQRVAISGIAGDQQAALFGQACVIPGMTKNTYGTGSFVLTNVGDTLPEP
ncbi:MAG TPA: FGGY family carbohydrate kinase, partial [Acidimicrobiia bacterium]|nr:FGGY family carbohydrate kinase [Acidimicrobiia bacterium]